MKSFPPTSHPGSRGCGGCIARVFLRIFNVVGFFGQGGLQVMGVLTVESVSYLGLAIWFLRLLCRVKFQQIFAENESAKNREGGKTQNRESCKTRQNNQIRTEGFDPERVDEPGPGLVTISSPNDCIAFLTITKNTKFETTTAKIATKAVISTRKHGGYA
jgi:hypothetical protein